MSDILQEIESIQPVALEAIRQAVSPKALEEQRIHWLGRKSRLMEWMKLLGTVPPEERAVLGKRLNQLKVFLETELKQRNESFTETEARVSIDITLPGAALPIGRLHPISQTISQIVSLFVSMGFEVIEGPEMEREYYNFDALNIPSDHPSREAFDTFFVDGAQKDPQKGQMVLRSHTSPVQIRVMEKRKPPVRIVVPGKVYRPDPLDANHSFMFHQIEGLMVDERTNFADLKGLLEHFLKRLFGPSRAVRFRPHFFPFTEPSAEVDIACGSCNGEGCATCGRKGWLEIMGCGMVHPKVLKAVGYGKYAVQGFAFGMGVERIAMLKHGISDIRLFFENDARFLNQF